MALSESVMDNFPDHLVPRPIQRELMAEIEEALKSGYKKMVLCAPTGSGKSPIAVTLAKWFKSSFLVTASKHLQDQYAADFEVLKSVKGKSNFACLQQMERASLKTIPHTEAIKMGLTCNIGECVKTLVEDGVEKTETCTFKPAVADFEYGPVDGQLCPYYTQKYVALTSSHSLWNYSAYFQILKYNQKTYRRYLDRQISIFDEAHKLEDQLIQFVGIIVSERMIQECGLRLDAHVLNDIDSVISLLDAMAEYYAQRIREIESSPAFQRNPDYDAIAPLEKKYEQVARGRATIAERKENFIINDPDTRGGRPASLSVVPLDIAPYTRAFFITPYQVFMSATIDRNSFCETAGLERDDVAFIDAPYSPFPVEHRTVWFMNVTRLNYRTPPDEKLKLFQAIDRILSKMHPDEKGLILTSSRDWCFQILSNLDSRNRARTRICHSTGNHGGATQSEIIKSHADSSNGVLLSSSLWEGIDLKDDLSRFQIIAKVPYPNFAEKRTAAKKEKYPLWYNAQTLTKLLQGLGRSVRSEDDWAKTYVLDSSVEYLIRVAKEMIPRSYHDVLLVRT